MATFRLRTCLLAPALIIAAAATAEEATPSSFPDFSSRDPNTITCGEYGLMKTMHVVPSTERGIIALYVYGYAMAVNSVRPDLHSVRYAQDLMDEACASASNANKTLYDLFFEVAKEP